MIGNDFLKRAGALSGVLLGLAIGLGAGVEARAHGPQADLAQASLAQASLAQVSLAQASLAQASLAQVSLPQVSRVTIAAEDDRTRVAIEMSEPVDYRVSPLREPDRLYLDFPLLEWKLARPGGEGRGDGQGLVRAYRFAQFDAATSRFVLDLVGPVVLSRAYYERPTQGRGYLLVLELEPAVSGGSRPSLDAARRGSSAARAAAAPARPPPPLRPPLRVIAIDPGHGGVDSGAVGAGGTVEKEVTLALGRELKRQLEETGRFRVVSTRETDVFVGLRERVQSARAAAAELLISIHADSLEATQARGASVYTLSETASDAEAAALAQRENRADIIAGIDLSQERQDVTGILIDLAQRETIARSVAFAALLVNELGREAQLLPVQPHRFAGFAVLRAPDLPAVLLELGYLSNRQEERLLGQAEHRGRLAGAVVRALDGFFKR